MTWLNAIGEFDNVDPKFLGLAWKLELSDLRPHLDQAAVAAKSGALEIFSAVEQPVRQKGQLLEVFSSRKIQTHL